MHQTIKTGTTTIGIVCKEGIVLVADKRATAGNFIADKKAEKIHQIADYVAVTIAGLVSDAQLLTKLARAELQLKKMRTGKESSVREAANLAAGMCYSNIRKLSMIPGIVAFLVGGMDNEGFHLYNIGVDGSISEVNDFTSDGSGSVFALGVLETLYRKDMSMEEGIKLGVKALNAALQRDSASGSGLDIATITKMGFKKIITKELELKVEI
ncbi:proteasome subunit beta [Candidatus Woesearchaeota archaeon]|nr:proteasome subunit beta [Candidatus Woesearchaeota archaeon]